MRPFPIGYISALALAVYAAWARAGTPVALQPPLPVLGVLLLLAVWLVPSRPALARVLRDPVVWAGLAFLALLAVQWWNAGRFLYFDPYHGSWGYTPPRVPWLTGAITRNEAAEMLRWFGPAWALLIFLRHGLQHRQAARWLLGALAINGLALAIFGMIQQWSGTRSIFWITDLGNTRFFASFGYENHAGSYFVLMSAISAGLLIDELLRRDRSPRPLHLTGWGVTAIVNFVGANLSYSRAGIILAWILATFSFIYVLRRGARYWRPSTSINVGLATLLAIVVGAMAIEQLGGATISREIASLKKTFDPETSRSSHSALVLGDRVIMLQAAGNIWQDYPWFGCGGWGYRYLMPYELPADNWKWSSTAYGKANVHNDPAQFLAEFGGVGFSLMIICVIGLIVPILRAHPKSPVTTLVLSGTTLVVLHSLVDLPFRSPAVLYAWLIALGCLAVLEGNMTGDRR